MKHTPENLVKEQIKDYLNIMGWFHFPITQGIGSFKGICDRIAIKKGKVLFIECKGPNGKLTPHQERFKKYIEMHGGIYVEARSYEDVAKHEKD
jgi:hypothetical protein